MFHRAWPHARTKPPIQQFAPIMCNPPKGVSRVGVLGMNGRDCPIHHIAAKPSARVADSAASARSPKTRRHPMHRFCQPASSFYPHSAARFSFGVERPRQFGEGRQRTLTPSFYVTKRTTPWGRRLGVVRAVAAKAKRDQRQDQQGVSQLKTWSPRQSGLRIGKAIGFVRPELRWLIHT